jgi:uncharacterized protein (TIGR02246 family)
MNMVTAIVSLMCVFGWPAIPAAAAEAPVSEARAAIEAANAKFSEVFARGDAAALAALYTSDAILFPPGEEMLRGNTPIGEFWKNSHDGGVAGAKLTTTDVERSGDVAVEVGKVELVIRAEGKPDSAASAKYLVVWNRQGDGTWKMHRDIWNELPAAK